jgi:uncharacterized protein (DUF2384 family)
MGELDDPDLNGVIAFAVQIFGNREKAIWWLNEADHRLAGKTPLSVLHSEAGRRTIMNMLVQIDEGIYS